MARVTINLPRPETVTVIDPQNLVDHENLPTVDPKTGVPSVLRACVVVKEPRMTVIPNFLTRPECDYLVKLVEGHWMPSLIGQATHSSDEDYEKGNLQNALSENRTSWSCMLRHSQTSVVERVEHRLSSITGLPVEQLERLNMVRYAPGELFDEHHDGRFRPITVFVYLNDLPEGDTGDTLFPVLGLSFRPRCGTAVMWSNVDGDKEDSRMLHMGCAPSKGVKYGVNCFFNVEKMRQIGDSEFDIPAEDVAVVDVRGFQPNGGEDKASGTSADGPGAEEPKFVAYCVSSDPKVLAVPGFLSPAEVEQLLASVPNKSVQLDNGPYRGGTQPLRSLKPGETPVVQAAELRLASIASMSVEHLSTLQVVRAGSRLGYCNRGCGPKSAYICLSDRDEVHFPKLGMRFVLRKGDALMWPNVSWNTGVAVEDMRTVRVHLGPGGHSVSSAIGVDAFFHDTPLRTQRRLREFVPDEARPGQRQPGARRPAAHSPSSACCFTSPCLRFMNSQ